MTEIPKNQEPPATIKAVDKDVAEGRCLRDGLRIMRSWNDLFGQPVVFVPIGRRSKRPRFRGWPRFTLELMEDERFIACIGRPNCNVAVSLGTPSRGLCTFDFDDDRNAETFLDLNPAFASTLATTARHGRNLWFFVDGDYPESFDVKGNDDRNIVEFRADGRLTVVHGTHPCGYSYRLLTRGRPIKIAWRDINWPFHWANQVPTLQNSPEESVTNDSGVPAVSAQGADELALDISKLTNVVERGDGTFVARCPACVEQGRDRTGNHLILYPNGAFGCVVFSGDSEHSRKHRQKIIELAGATN